MLKVRKRIKPVSKPVKKVLEQMGVAAFGLRHPFYRQKRYPNIGLRNKSKSTRLNCSFSLSQKMQRPELNPASASKRSTKLYLTNKFVFFFC